eukprot:Hpha_TRINITY_DN35393_c0_g1::TRINITY_DN35393_c0_g1_i1::g.85124::m.85124
MDGSPLFGSDAGSLAASGRSRRKSHYRQSAFFRPPPTRPEWPSKGTGQWAELWNGGVHPTVTTLAQGSRPFVSRGLREVQTIARMTGTRRGTRSRNGASTAAPPPTSGSTIVAVDGTLLCVGGITGAEGDTEPAFPVWAYTTEGGWVQQKPEGKTPAWRSNFAAASVVVGGRLPPKGGLERGVSVFVSGGMSHGERASVL